MNRVFAIVAFAALVTSPAFASSSGCSTAPKTQWQPTATLETMLKGKGYTVRQIKTEKGCYEVYATDKSGQRVNMAYNAETLKLLVNAEAGEN